LFEMFSAEAQAPFPRFPDAQGVVRTWRTPDQVRGRPWRLENVYAICMIGDFAPERHTLIQKKAGKQADAPVRAGKGLWIKGAPQQPTANDRPHPGFAPHLKSHITAPLSLVLFCLDRSPQFI